MPEVGFVGPNAPMGRNELEAMDVGEIVGYLSD